MSDTQALPSGPPAPVDDGAARHLPGLTLPSVTLPVTDGAAVDLSALGPGRTVLYVYPRTARPGVPLPEGWDEIPGARGCTPESCGFRDHHADLLTAGAAAVHGISAQSADDQREAADRLRLPYTLLSDPGGILADALRLPTFEAGGDTLYKRLTLVVRDGHVEHVWYPVFPPGEHAGQVLDWLRTHPA